MLYPDRQVFFEELALSLPPQPRSKSDPPQCLARSTNKDWGLCERKLDFAAPVVDLSSEDLPLIRGRLDLTEHRLFLVNVLQYRTPRP